MTTDTAAKNAAFLGRLVPVQFVNNRTGELRTQDYTMRPFRVGDYPGLMELIANEPALVEAALRQSRGSLFAADQEEDITPESYEALAVAMKEVCAGFFAYLQRQMPLVDRVILAHAKPPGR